LSATNALRLCRNRPGLPVPPPNAKIPAMKPTAAAAALLLSISVAIGQTPENSPSPQIEALTKKVDEINSKIDALSQQILKLEQQISRPGVMIGEVTPGPSSPSSSASMAGSPASQDNGNTHVVARGETLTAIAKQHKISVEDLQKFNHIEDGRKLQAGQTIMIPPASASPAASTSPSPSPSATE
jgi:LysM repeat protein